jgi:hypothetical protein
MMLLTSGIKLKIHNTKIFGINLIKEFADGFIILNDGMYQLIPLSKADDGTYIFIGRSKLHGPVRDTKTKTNRLR